MRNHDNKTVILCPVLFSNQNIQSFFNSDIVPIQVITVRLHSLESIFDRTLFANCW